LRSAPLYPLAKREYPYPLETAKDMKKAANSFEIDYNIVTKKKTYKNINLNKGTRSTL
jgi:hypothetical protein